VSLQWQYQQLCNRARMFIAFGCMFVLVAAVLGGIELFYSAHPASWKAYVGVGLVVCLVVRISVGMFNNAFATYDRAASLLHPFPELPEDCFITLTPRLHSRKSRVRQ
jgi:hypothetical protein